MPHDALPEAVEIVEVSPRDGLQNEKTQVSTADKLQLIAALVDAGARRIEATSFVNPARVPQMADAAEVMAGVARDRGVSYSGLVLNRKGAERALAAGCDELSFAMVSTETFAQRNQKQTVAEGVAVWRDVAAMARAGGKRVAVCIAAAFGCPFEGRVDPAHVESLAMQAMESRPDELALADTIGVATPGQVTALFGRLRARVGGVTLRAHFHNTRNTGYANAYAALQSGVTVLDSSAGGIGGCPFAPRATGNIATEDLLYMLDGLGVAHGMDRGRVAALDGWLAGRLGHGVPGQLGKVDAWPPVRHAA